MTERDRDQAWLDALAGRGGDAEALRLREGILARRVEDAPPVAEFDLRREEGLLARARREGLLPQPWWRSRAGLSALAAAASVVIAIGLMNRPERGPRIETVRSSPGGVVLVEARGAHDLQHAIADELAAAGVSAVVYDRLGFFGIDADLPTPIPPAVEEILMRHRIPVPDDGVLKLEIAEIEGR